MAYWTTDDLVNAVSRKVVAPSSGLQLTPQEILDIAWEETIKRLVPAVRAVREDYWTTTKDFAVVADQPGQRVPTRAAASSATSFWIVQATGERPVRLNRVPASERQRWANAASDVPSSYCLEGDTVYLLPRPNAAMTLRVQYDRRPARYVPTSDCAFSNGNIGYAGNDLIVVVASSPMGASGYADMVQGDPPCDVLFENERFVYDVGTLTFTFLGDGSQDWQAMGLGTNDWICPSGTTCVPPLPDVLHPALVDLTAVQFLSDFGFTSRALALKADIAEYLPGLLQTLAIRVSADPQIAFNPDSPLRVSGWGGGLRGVW
jgi:hypothetical protein